MFRRLREWSSGRQQLEKHLEHRLALDPLPPLPRNKLLLRRYLPITATLLFVAGLVAGSPSLAIIGGLMGYTLLLFKIDRSQMRRSGERFLARNAQFIDRMLDPGERITLSSSSRVRSRNLLLRGVFYQHVLVTDRPRVFVLRPSFWPWSAPKIVDAIPLEEVVLTDLQNKGFWGRPLKRDIQFARAGSKSAFTLAMPDDQESLALAQALRLGAGRLSIIAAGDEQGRLSTPRSDGALSEVEPIRSRN